MAELNNPSLFSDDIQNFFASLSDSVVKLSLDSDSFQKDVSKSLSFLDKTHVLKVKIDYLDDPPKKSNGFFNGYDLDKFYANLEAQLKSGAITLAEYNTLAERNVKGLRPAGWTSRPRGKRGGGGSYDYADFPPDDQKWMDKATSFAPEEDVDRIRAEMADNLSSYYARVKFLDKDYYNFRLNLIETEGSAYMQALGDKFDATAFFGSQIQALDNEQAAFLDKFGPIEFDDSPLPNIANRFGDLSYYQDLALILDKIHSRFQLINLEPVLSQIENIRQSSPRNYLPGGVDPVDPIDAPTLAQLAQTWNRGELFANLIRSSQFARGAFNDLASAAANSFDFMKINLSSTASSMEKIWGGMINRMIDRVLELFAQWAIFNVIGGIFGLGGLNLGDLLGLGSSRSGGGGIPKGAGMTFGNLTSLGNTDLEALPNVASSRETRDLLASIREAVIANTLDRRMIGNKPVVVQPKIFLNNRELTKEVSNTSKTLAREGWKQD